MRHFLGMRGTETWEVRVVMIAVLLTASACAEMQKRLDAAVADRHAAEAPVESAARSANDGYTWVEPLDMRDHDGPKERIKWRTSIALFMPEAGQTEGPLPYLRPKQHEIESLIREGKLPKDRYYAEAAVGIVSVPMSERAEFIRNAEENNLYLWASGACQRF